MITYKAIYGGIFAEGYLATKETYVGCVGEKQITYIIIGTQYKICEVEDFETCIQSVLYVTR